MRVSPAGWAFDTVEKVLAEAEKSAAVTHNHPEGIKGAQATALAVFLARTGQGKETIKAEIESHFGYDLSPTLDEIRPGYSFDVSCQGSVPQAIIAFLEADDVEVAIRNAISLGGDSDTLACIAGGIAHAYFGELSDLIVDETCRRLPDEFLTVMDQFNERYGC
jgi:ADP-ribosylglycohydrolase